MLKIIKTKIKETITKTVTYQTKHFDIVETVINDKLDSIRLTCDDKDLTPMMLNAPDWNQYKNFYYFLDQRIKIKSLDDIDLNKVYFAYTAGHVLFDLNKKPVSIPYLLNYIGSLKERHPNDKVYERLISLLKEHSFVIELKTDKIPYYNATFSGQRGISFAKILLSQEKYEELYNKCKGGDYWSVRMKDNIKFALNTDIYGNEIKDLLEEYHN
jgi:hypothetical protein